MPTLLLVRHGRSTANTAGVLAGWTPGVELDDTGREQAAGLVGRLSGLPLAHAVTSPLERCRQTVAPLLAARPELGEAAVDERLGECKYGDWTGRPLHELAKEPLWRTVQDHASAAAFPGGESLRDLSHRTVEAVREWDAKVAASHGEDALWLACTHGDVIKAVVADALGLHLDQFQRISVEPCSVTAIRYTPHRPFLLRLGDTGGLGGLAPKQEPAQVPGGDAVVGGTS
ncbi:histidine phosphatase family protein [Kitasatospora sp. DSM 101779]|uniref:histidine phosphatase family protein n=1 Tax=Kitasatospora sp. DSM 101779 TaxID=2853165 RepID=UPI0021D97C71|nr:histidine phosphatase family protein [Kitasatospora sp. DSM 101779]MCU7821655.1 MSMEG_4193 family putative phosphomutase [Kitasatospora sp. DSM 101779]